MEVVTLGSQSLSSTLEVSWASRRNTEDGRCPLEDPVLTSTLV